jgi:hypothetical protein
MTPRLRHGCANSFEQMSLFEERSTSAISAMSSLPIWTDLLSVISSPESVAGLTPCDLPVGLTHAGSGRDPVPVSLSPQPGKAMDSVTTGTSGPPFTVSSRTLCLQSCLASRLRHRLDCNGSVLFKLTWKDQVMPSGLPICRLRASARRTSDKDSSGWPSPLVNDSKGSNYTYNQGRHDSISLKLGGAAQLASPWATPAARDYHSESATDAFNDKRWTHPRGKPLSAQATLSTWPTPTLVDYKGPNPLTRRQGDDDLPTRVVRVVSWPTPTSSLADKGVRSLEGGINEALRSRGPDLAAVSCLASWGTPTQPSGLNLQAMLATWPTPRTPTGGAESAQRKQELGRTESGGSDLAAVAILSNWPTPMAGTPAQKGYNEAGNTDSSRKTVELASGTTASGFLAETANTGQLNPAFSRWLQGYPAVWDECAIRAFRSIPTTRPKREP